MKIRLIVVQYPQRYEGELMPNIVDAWDEYVLEDNYVGFEEALQRHQAMAGPSTDSNRAYDAVSVLDVEIPDKAVLDLFKESIPTVQAKVLPEPGVSPTAIDMHG